jgi:hypothetical protein
MARGCISRKPCRVSGGALDLSGYFGNHDLAVPGGLKALYDLEEGVIQALSSFSHFLVV